MSASGIIGGIKEYMYGGIKQLPLILASTSLIFAVTTGSVAHMNIFLGMAFIMPFLTFFGIYTLFNKVISYAIPLLDLSRSSGDTSSMLPPSGPKTLDYFTKDVSRRYVPSYWVTSVFYFLGYAVMNAVDNLTTASANNNDSTKYSSDALEKRHTQATIVLSSTLLFAAMLIFVRFVMMGDAEGRGAWGKGISAVFALISGLIGAGIYELAKKCGARSSDLFGILSQILPPSSTSTNPIVCTSD